MLNPEIYTLGFVIFNLCLIQNNHAWNIMGLEFKMPKILERNNYNPLCYLQECCNDDWIKFKKARLMKNISEQVYGQPLLETAVNALSSHFNPYFPPTKALSLSFHGMTGTGKNYVSNFIVDSMFKKGTKSRFVHHFIGRMHFAQIRHIDKYRSDLYSWLKGNISECARQVFVFDEVDKMVPEILNMIKPMIDYRNDVDGVDYSQAVFIFLSNTGADVINEHYHDLHSQGINREDLTIADFETFIQRGAFNEQGGFHHSDAIKSNLIDHYIPFLPLEEKHIIMCIKKEFLIRKVPNPKPDHIKEVLKFIEWGPDSSKFFSKTGCKRLGPKVGLLVDKYYKQYSFDDKEEL